MTNVRTLVSRCALTAAVPMAVVLFVGWSTQRAAAELTEHAHGAGAALAGFVELLGRETAVELNGHVLHLSTATTDRDLAQVLRRFEALCAEPLAQPARAPRATPTQPASRPLLQVTRDASGRERAVAACMAPREPGARSLAAQLSAYAASGDLAAFGQLRYLFARRRDAGGTHLVFAWNEGPLHAERMFPAEGDAAGSDLPGVPRPRGARRVLSAEVRNAPYGLAAYAVSDAPRPALERYGSELTRAGFELMHLESGGEQALAAIVRGEEHTIVHSFRQQGQTILGLVRTGQHRHSERAPSAQEAHHGE